MPKIADIIEAMRRTPKGIRFQDLCKVCDHYFGEARQTGSSHRVYKTPWQGDPRVNIQNDKGKAKTYQVKQVLKAIERLEEEGHVKNDRYTYRITWSEDDQEYVGLCLEFPSLAGWDESPEVALSGIRQVVADVVKDMKSNGETPSEPLASKKYSGKFMVRIPPELHRKLVIEAQEEGISLNRLASNKLSKQDM